MYTTIFFQVLIKWMHYLQPCNVAGYIFGVPFVQKYAFLMDIFIWVDLANCNYAVKHHITVTAAKSAFGVKGKAWNVAPKWVLFFVDSLYIHDYNS